MDVGLKDFVEIQGRFRHSVLRLGLQLVAFIIIAIFNRYRNALTGVHHVQKSWNGWYGQTLRGRVCCCFGFGFEYKIANTVPQILGLAALSDHTAVENRDMVGYRFDLIQQVT